VHEREAPTIGTMEAVLEDGFVESRGVAARLEKWRSALNATTREQAAQ